MPFFFNNNITLNLPPFPSLASPSICPSPSPTLPPSVPFLTHTIPLLFCHPLPPSFSFAPSSPPPSSLYPSLFSIPLPSSLLSFLSPFRPSLSSLIPFSPPASLSAVPLPFPQQCCPSFLSHSASVSLFSPSSLSQFDLYMYYVYYFSFPFFVYGSTYNTTLSHINLYLTIYPLLSNSN